MTEKILSLEEKLYWLGFSLFPDIGPKRFFLLLKYFASAQKIWQAPAERLKQLGLSADSVDRFVDFRQKINLEQELIKLEHSQVRFITFQDREYPQILKEIADPAIGLFVRGRILPKDKKALAVVGTRKMTTYGQQATKKFVTDLVKNGFTIISGLARGVDGLAHRVALGCHGRTIAVMGCGLDRIYPPEHRVLAENIGVGNQGALISEFPLGVAPNKVSFPRRNRIVSGMSLGVLVIEGASRSGTKITARLAAEQGREVFAVPGPINSDYSQGPAELIKLGAKLVTKVDDILEELHPNPDVHRDSD